MTDVPLPGSVRMIFEVDGDGLRLLRQHPVNVAVDLSQDQQPGDYVEVRGGDGQAMSRVPVWTCLGTSIETFPEDPYISADGPRVITVVVPAPPGSDHVAVVRTSAGTAEVLGTFPLHH